MCRVLEDKDNGVIQVKTEKEFSISVGMGLKCIYKYEYLTKFRFKDNKYKIEIYDINCVSAEQTGAGKVYSVPLIFRNSLNNKLTYIEKSFYSLISSTFLTIGYFQDIF